MRLKKKLHGHIENIEKNYVQLYDSKKSSFKTAKKVTIYK